MQPVDLLHCCTAQRSPMRAPLKAFDVVGEVAKGAVTRGRLTANALCRYTAFFFEESVCQLGLAWPHLRTFTGALASRLPFLLCCSAKS